jgi:3-hydroxyisobutyrate dehydrogenase-like beta-hydroxyacid dehydrogenase
MGARADKPVVGFIGLGRQGAPIAHRIADAGLPIVVWARQPKATEPFAAKGAIVAADIADLAMRCDHVGLCVFSDADVVEVGEALITNMRPGSRIAIHSTVLPETCMALAERCAASGIGLIDAPVSGGAEGAKAGRLSVMCGGSLSLFEAAKPVFETFAKLVVLLGDVGAGQRAKIVNNALLAANIGLADAAIAAGARLGLDRDKLVEVIRSSSGYSHGVEVCGMNPTPSDFRGAGLLVKDVGLLMSMLPDDSRADALRAAAMPYLHAATGHR